MELSERDNEILGALVRRSLAPGFTAFEIQPGGDTLEDSEWPSNVAAPTREEIRALVLRDLLQIDKSVPRVWRFWPSAPVRSMFSDSDEKALEEALSDPDQRLGVILNAVVDAFEQDPSTPPLLVRTAAVDIIKHPHWPMSPDVVRLHDLSQLADLHLIGWQGNEFYPTPSGRTAARNPATFFSQRADEAGDEAERSRLRALAEKFRAGDIAVGTTSGVTGAVIRALLGL